MIKMGPGAYVFQQHPRQAQSVHLELTISSGLFFNEDKSATDQDPI